MIDAPLQVEQLVSVKEVAFRVRCAGERRRFWDRVAAGQWEPQTFRVFRRFLEPGSSCVDIGAWVGATALYAAHLARRVHAIEPDPVALAELAANVAANPALDGRIALHRQCIAPVSGPIDLHAGGMYHSAGSAFGDSMSGIRPSPGADQPSRRVDGVALDAFMATHTIDDCSLIKMDVEGGEYSLIPGHWRRLARYGMPALCVSFHAPPAAEREPLIGACFEELGSCYSFLYSASDQSILSPAGMLSTVDDWRDDAQGSAWTELERLLSDGVVASNQQW